jgi:hypothetical protein
MRWSRRRGTGAASVDKCMLREARQQGRSIRLTARRFLRTMGRAFKGMSKSEGEV